MESRSPVRVLVFLLGVAALAFVLIQFFGPHLDNPPVTAEIQAAPGVRQVLRNSCYSCRRENRLDPVAARSRDALIPPGIPSQRDVIELYRLSCKRQLFPSPTLH